MMDQGIGQPISEWANHRMMDWANVRMYARIIRSIIQPINQRTMDPSDAHLLKRPLDLPMNELKNRAVNEGTYNKIHLNTIRRNICNII